MTGPRTHISQTRPALVVAAGRTVRPGSLALLPGAAAAVQYGPPATGPISFEQAKCMLRGKKIAFIGDSNSRYHYFSFNVFLDCAAAAEAHAVASTADRRARRLGPSAATRAADTPRCGGLDVHQRGGGLLG